MSVVVAHAEGCVIAVRAQPGARRNAVVGPHHGAIKIAVTAPPDKGKANDALADVLAGALSVPISTVRLISGPTSRDKKFLVRGLSPRAAEQSLEPYLKPH